MTPEQIKEEAEKWSRANLERLKKFPLYTQMLNEAFIAGAALTAHLITDADIEWAKNRMNKEPEHKSVLTPEQEFLQMNTPIGTAHPPQHTEKKEIKFTAGKWRGGGSTSFT